MMEYRCLRGFCINAHLHESIRSRPSEGSRHHADAAEDARSKIQRHELPQVDVLNSGRCAYHTHSPLHNKLSHLLSRSMYQ